MMWLLLDVIPASVKGAIQRHDLSRLLVATPSFHALLASLQRAVRRLTGVDSGRGQDRNISLGNSAVWKMAAVSPNCESVILAARARGTKTAANARSRTLLCGGETGH